MGQALKLTEGQQVGTCFYLRDTDKVKGNRLAEFRCYCGNTFTTLVTSVKVGNTKSCGCFKKATLFNRSVIHNQSKKHNPSKEYTAWQAMKDRCYNKNHINFYNYGGRGIKVCERWVHSFENFIADMGTKPPRKSNAGI